VDYPGTAMVEEGSGRHLIESGGAHAQRHSIPAQEAQGWHHYGTLQNGRLVHETSAQPLKPANNNNSEQLKKNMEP
jgi:hypothetical protein